MKKFNKWLGTEHGLLFSAISITAISVFLLIICLVFSLGSLQLANSIVLLLVGLSDFKKYHDVAGKKWRVKMNMDKDKSNRAPSKWGLIILIAFDSVLVILQFLIVLGGGSIFFLLGLPFLMSSLIDSIQEFVDRYL